MLEGRGARLLSALGFSTADFSRLGEAPLLIGIITGIERGALVQG